MSQGDELAGRVEDSAPARDSGDAGFAAGIATSVTRSRPRQVNGAAA
jgi:hypothetical protein